MFFLVTTVNCCDSIRGVQYFDCQAEYAELLCLKNILSAQEAAATALNYVVVTQLQREGDRITKIICEDGLTGEIFTVNVGDSAQDLRSYSKSRIR